MRALLVATIVGFLTGSAIGQSTMDWPVGESFPYVSDSGARQNAAGESRTVFVENIHIENAAWLRVYFGEVKLEGESFLRITSALDGEVQALDAAAVAMWRNTTAYFNGDTVTVELVAGAGTAGNQFVIESVTGQIAEPQAIGGICGVCGADDRVPSSETWTGRLLPAGCTASVWNIDSCLVSAGHCISGSDVIQFNVPASNPNCSLNHPPVADQFPTTNELFTNNGVGDDWAVMTTGTNNLGQKPYDRFANFRGITTEVPLAGQLLTITGYGVDDQCVNSQAQQTSSDLLEQAFSDFITHFVETTGGNSGSAIIKSNKIMAIATHCSCNAGGNVNYGTRVDHSDFAAAREALCPEHRGACCLASGQCANFVTIQVCNAISGVYQGDDTACVTTECPQPEGACCLPSGACVENTPPDCSAALGTFEGAGTICAETTCPQPVGACCLGGGSCLEVTADSCASAGGTFQGANTECPTDCSQVATSILSAVSCVQHGLAGTFCLELSGGTEPRAPGVASVEFELSDTVNSVGALVSCSTPYGGTPAVTIMPGNTTVKVDLPGGLPDEACCVITLTGDVDDSQDVFTLKGDADRNGSTNGADITTIKPNLGMPVNGSNFALDVDANGNINGADITAVKPLLGGTSPVCP